VRAAGAVQGREITITTEMGTVEPDRALTNANGERSVRRDDMELRFGFSVTAPPPKSTATAWMKIKSDNQYRTITGSA
jgi:hypothetical protein